MCSSASCASRSRLSEDGPGNGRRDHEALSHPVQPALDFTGRPVYSPRGSPPTSRPERRAMELERPLPQPITPEAKPYWDGLREQKLMLPALPRLPARLLLPAGALPVLPRLRHRVVPGERPRASSTPSRSRYQTFNKAFKVKPPVRARHDRAGGGPAHDVESDRHRARSEEASAATCPSRWSSRSTPTRSRCRCSSPREVRDERAPELGLHRRRGRERRARHAAPQEPAHACIWRRCGTRCATPASRSATSTASSRRASTRLPPSARRSASSRATSTAPPWAAAPSSSWSATPWLPCIMGSAMWPWSATASPAARAWA